MNNTAKNSNILESSTLSVLHNYFDDLTKLFSNLFLAKLLNTLAKLCIRNDSAKASKNLA